MNRVAEGFKKTWEKQIIEIKKRPMNNSETYKIWTNFSLNRSRLQLMMKGDMTEEEYYETYLVLENLESEVKVALAISRSKYSEQKLSIWVRILETISGLITSIIDYLRSLRTG